MAFGYFLAPKDKQKRRENKFISKSMLLSPGAIVRAERKKMKPSENMKDLGCMCKFHLFILLLSLPTKMKEKLVTNNSNF